MFRGRLWAAVFVLYHLLESPDKVRCSGVEQKTKDTTYSRNSMFQLSTEPQRCCHRLPREGGEAPSLQVLKARLDGVLRNLV